MSLKFNVFGKHMSVLKVQGQWQLFTESETGIRARVYDVVIPCELVEDDIGKYLDDIYHEYASDSFPTDLKIN